MELVYEDEEGLVFETSSYVPREHPRFFATRRTYVRTHAPARVWIYLRLLTVGTCHLQLSRAG